MGVFAGPEVVEDGLVLALDAGNNKSHSTNRFISYGTGLTTQNVTFQVNGTGTFQRVAAGTVIGGYEVKTTDVVYSYALGSNGCHYHGNTAPIPAGVYATFSFDYLVTGATTYPINNFLASFENYGGGALGGSIAAANNLQNVWQRRTFTSGPTSSAGTQAMFLYPGSCGNGRLADSGTIYFRNPKVEFTNVDTGNGNFSSMPNLTTWYDISGNGNNGTLTNGPVFTLGNGGSLVFDGTDDRIDLSTAIGTVSQYTISYWAKRDAENRMPVSTINGDFYWFGDNSWRYVHGGVAGEYYYSKPTSIPLGTWGYYAAVYNGSNVSIYRQGVYQGQQATTGTANFSSALRIGWWGNNTYAYLGNIANVSFYNRALTASEIQQNYNATKSRYGL